VSNRLSLDEQAKLTGDAWERLPEPRPSLSLELVAPTGESKTYYLGAHMPKLRPEDLDLLHRLWLQATEDPRYANLHHYHLVALALRDLEQRMQNGGHPKVLEELLRDSSQS
jgi:hypothetical protein